MKKVLAVLMTVVCFAATIPMQTWASLQASNPTISVDTVQANAGEEVTVDVSIAGNPGVCYLHIEIGYSDDLLMLTGLENKNLLGGMFQEGPDGQNPKRMIWANTSGTQDGVLASLTFKVLDDAPIWNASLTVSVREAYDLTEAMNDVSFNTIHGGIDIDVPPTGVVLNKTSISIKEQETYTLTATVSPENAEQVVNWESANEQIATVDANGQVTAVGIGSTEITATTKDGQYFAKCSVDVTCAHLGEKTTYEYKAPTCTEEGNSNYTVCNVCDEVIVGEQIVYPIIAHDLIHHPYAAPTHMTLGNTEYWECNSCGQYFSDANANTIIADKLSVTLSKLPEHDHSGEWKKDAAQHWKECECGDVAQTAEHEYDNSCDTTCNICGYVRSITHTWKNEYSWNADSHWIECSVCGAKKDEVQHECTAEVVADKYLKSEATQDAGAVYYKSCSVCGGIGNDTFSINKESGKISVSSARGYLGKEVSVTISVEDNPGFVSMLLSVHYDTNALRLKSVSDKGLVPGAMHSNDLTMMPYRLNWANDTASENITANGDIVVLTFEVLENAPIGKTKIEVSYRSEYDNILDVEFNPVYFEVNAGEIDISNVLIGDVDGNGVITQKDRMVLARYIAGWTGYSIDELAADVDGNGVITQKDRMILARYIAGWAGYTELPYKG